VLVNNAGGPPPGDRLPHGGFLERGGGAIVNVSSGTGRQPQAFNVDYSAAKATSSRR
jgi:short-subunit dehydrogenase